MNLDKGARWSAPGHIRATLKLGRFSQAAG